MTVAQMGPLQTAVYQAVVAAAPGIVVSDYVLTTPPAEFIRLEGFAISDQSPKNGEIGRHVFEVHFFSRPGSEGVTSRGNKRPNEVMAAVHAALMAGTFLGTKLNFEMADVDPGEDGATTHARARYSVTL